MLFRASFFIIPHFYFNSFFAECRGGGRWETNNQKKFFLDKTNDITLNITEEVANKAFDNCVVVDEVCPDVEFNAASA